MYADDLTSKEINIVPFTGYYKTENEFIKDAVNTLLSARKDLRIAIACELYKREEISIGKACEIASLTIEEMKEIFNKKGMSRHEDASVDELGRMAERAVELAGR